MEAANEHLHYGRYFVPSPVDSRGGLLEGIVTNKLFWEKYAEVTGTEVQEDAGNFFSCSC